MVSKIAACNFSLLSEAQLRFMNNLPFGIGIIKHGSVCIPFDNRMRKEDPPIYGYMRCSIQTCMRNPYSGYGQQIFMAIQGIPCYNLEKEGGFQKTVQKIEKWYICINTGYRRRESAFCAIPIAEWG